MSAYSTIHFTRKEAEDHMVSVWLKNIEQTYRLRVQNMNNEKLEEHLDRDLRPRLHNAIITEASSDQW